MPTETNINPTEPPQAGHSINAPFTNTSHISPSTLKSPEILVTPPTRPSRSEVNQSERERLVESIQRYLPDFSQHGSLHHKCALTLNGVITLETKRQRGFCEASFDFAYFSFPIIGFEEARGAAILLARQGLLAVDSDGSFRSTSLGKELDNNIQLFKKLEKQEKRLRQLRLNPSTHTHETFDRSAWVMMSEILLCQNVGQSLARTILESGGRLAILHHQDRPHGSIHPLLREARQKGRPYAASLVHDFGGDYVCRLNVAAVDHDDAGYHLDAGNYWLRDQVGMFGIDDFHSLPGSSRVSYFSTQLDLLVGQSGYFSPQEIIDTSHSPIRRVKLAAHAVGGFFYPLGVDKMAVSSAVYARHNENTDSEWGPLRGIRLDLTSLSEELSMLGREQVIELPPLFSNPRHIDTAVTQIDNTIFTPKIDIDVNLRTLPDADLNNLVVRTGEIRSRLENYGNVVTELPMPYVMRHGKQCPLLTVNLLQYYNDKGERNVMVPWLEDYATDAERSELESTRQSIEAALLEAGANRVVFFPFPVTNGGLRCATQHIPQRAIDLMRATHEVI